MSLQGVGGGGLAPSEQAILADTFPPEKRGQAFAMYGLAVVCAPAIGPTLGGYITDNFDWRWIFFLNVPICLLSLFLTSRIVEDPPWVEKQVKQSQKGGIKLDFLGFGLLGLTFGSLEFVLDKGQEDDWFSSHLITFFTVAMIVAFIVMIWWELKQLREGHRPILNLTLFKRPNFSISFLLMFVLGFSLYGTTILIPQLVQTLLGYTAELAGLVLSPAGLMMMCMMPVVGFLVGRVDPRKLIAYGFVMLTISLITMHTMDLGVSYGRLVFLRCFQASGLAFLFIPINTIAYIGVKQSENNDVSGLTNLARNIGGSCGTAFMATMLTRRTAAHENSMTRNLTSGNQAFMNQVAKLKGFFGGHTQRQPNDRNRLPHRPGLHLQPASSPGSHARLPRHHPVHGDLLRLHASTPLLHPPPAKARQPLRRPLSSIKLSFVSRLPWETVLGPSLKIGAALQRNNSPAEESKNPTSDLTGKRGWSKSNGAAGAIQANPFGIWSIYQAPLA